MLAGTSSRKRQESTGSQHAEHVSEVGTCRHLDIFRDVAEGLASFQYSSFQNHQVFFQKDDVRAFFSDVHRCIYGDTYLGLTQCGGIVDTVTEETDRMFLFLKQSDDFRFLQRSQFGEVTMLAV